MTNKKTTRPLTAISLAAARLSIAAVISYQVLLVALIFIRPDLDPSWHTISEWAIGSFGWVMSLAFHISALSYGSLWTAGLPLLGLVGFLVHLAIFVIPLEVEYGPGVPLGWPPRFLFLTYMIWLITLACQAIKVRSHAH